MSNLKPDVTLKEFWRDNGHFADLFNTVFFDGRNVLKPEELEELEERDTDMSVTVTARRASKSLTRQRDVVKTAQGIDYAILGIENETHVNYAMPLRIRTYEDLQYIKQVQELTAKYRMSNASGKKGKNRKYKRKKNRKNKRNKMYITDMPQLTRDEFLSGLRRTDRLRACLTIVLYYGQKPWDGSVKFSDMVDVPEELKEYFQDYRMHLLCVSENDGQAFPEGEARKLFQVLHALHSREMDQIQGVVVEPGTYRAIASIWGNGEVQGKISEEQEGGINVRGVMNDICDEKRAEGKAESILDLLEDLGAVPKDLSDCIMKIGDKNILKRLLKLASKSKSLEQFEVEMHLICPEKG